ncbi:hypothetical protein JQ616_17720 [Bradyrhizobium tropiciagri]|uniref:hypothetical protein n=1 Tax=Bradyrhizobium tropiciagri TaxID=312253 RepID=UPI001BA84277|nr:hypothetical protein [Bradyrhizobium tropiciagri]MBR0896803.1 hypothetical protein [Bradyrhizobium tropiciagri]
MSYDSMGDNEAEKRAIHDFFIHVTLPILIEEGGQFGIAATGTLFKIACRHFIITAAHTYDAFHPDRWHFPSHPRKGKIHTLGLAEYIHPSSNKDALDIAAVELKDSESIAVLEENWRFLTLDNVWLPDYSADAIIVAGYPSVRARFDEADSNLYARIFIVRQKFRTETPEAALRDGLTKGVDFFIDYQDAVNEYTGEEISTVSIKGLSGCSVWGYRKRGWINKGFWSAEVPLKVIGIQSAERQGQYLRAKSWGAIIRLLQLLDPDVRDAAEQTAQAILSKLNPKGG